MKAGFAKLDITPPVGTPLMGYGDSSQRLAEGIHDPLHVRALSVRHERGEALLLTFDFCFIGREESERFAGVLGRELGLRPSQILMNVSHTHAGPAIGSYYDLEYAAPQRDYLRRVEAAMLDAARKARTDCREVNLRAGMSRTTIPMNRRLPRGGKIVNAPNPDGPIVDSLPLCLLEDRAGEPVALLFAASTHVVCMRRREISADWPGVAMDALDKHFGRTCAMFLQGVGGDSRPRVLGEGRDEWNWDCDWPEATAVGEQLTREVLAGLGSALKPAPPKIQTHLIDTHWPLQSLPRTYYEEVLQRPRPADGSPTLEQRWAERQLRLLNQGPLRRSASILMQGIQLAEGVRMIAIEGEPLGAHGRAVEAAWPDGTTFAVGYSNGEGIYLVTSPMLDEGGYEPESFWEYGHPAPLAKGLEAARDAGLAEIRRAGVA